MAVNDGGAGRGGLYGGGGDLRRRDRNVGMFAYSVARAGNRAGNRNFEIHQLVLRVNICA